MNLQEQLDFVNRENRFMIHNGIQITQLEPDCATAEMEVTPSSMNPVGCVHGGAYFTIADCVAGAVSRTDGRRYVTIDADIHFLHGAVQGRLIAHAQVRHRGKSACRVAVTITDGTGRLLCDMNCTMFCIGDMPRTEA